jgi:AraC-like DNA-binding protein
MSDPERFLHGVATQRREGAPPWQVDAATPVHTSVHVIVRGSFQLAEPALRPLDLETGDIVLIGAAPTGEPALQLHCVAQPHETGAAPELLSAVYAPTDAPADLAARAPVVHLRADDVRRQRGLPAVVSLLRAALVDPSPGQDRLARSLLDPLLAYVLHCRDSAGKPTAANEAPRDPRIARALQRLTARPAEPWTVASLAKAAGLSRAAFARRFHAELGVPPLRYLAEVRMRDAERLLAEGEASLAFIAAQVGYESEFAFSRAFKRHTGEAPGVYRRRVRSDRAAFRASATRAAA